MQSYLPVQLLRSGIRAYPLWQLHSQLPSELVQKVSQPPFSMVHSSMSDRQKHKLSPTAGIQPSDCLNGNRMNIFERKQSVICSIRTDTVQSVLSRFVSRVTGTLVAADHIDTLAVPAQPVTQLTFIDICERTKQWSNSHTQFKHHICMMAGSLNPWTLNASQDGVTCS